MKGANNMGAMKETMGFQTEVKQLLHLIVKTVFVNPEIIIRQ